MSPQTASTSQLIIHYPSKLWLGQLSKDFPHANIQITAFVPIKQDPFVGNSMITIRSVEIEKILSQMEKYPSLLSYSIMEQSGNTLVLSTRTKDDLLLRAIVKNTVLIQLPVKVLKGTAEFIINGSRTNIDDFISDLNSKGIQVDIKNLGHFSEDLLDLKLTTRQFEVYQEAKKHGYYDNPRRINLTNLAEKLGIAKSSLSGMLQRIHNALLGN